MDGSSEPGSIGYGYCERLRETLRRDGIRSIVCVSVRNRLVPERCSPRTSVSESCTAASDRRERIQGGAASSRSALHSGPKSGQRSHDGRRSAIELRPRKFRIPCTDTQVLEYNAFGTILKLAELAECSSSPTERSNSLERSN